MYPSSQGDAGNGVNVWWTSRNRQKRALDITGAAHWRVFVYTISWNIFIWDHLGMVPSAVSFRSSERERKKKKSISDNMRDRKLAAAQIRLPTFDKRKWANLVYPSKRLQSNTFLLWLSKTHERGRARARGEALQPRSGSMEEEGGCTGCSFYSEERLAVLFFRPAPLLTPPHCSRWAQLCLKDASPSARGRRSRRAPR